MLKVRGKHLWLFALVSTSVYDAQAAPDAVTHTGRQFNPYHEQQLQDDIRKCASGVLACTDAETRCVKQQELCQLLIRSERYDEALQVANNVYKTDTVEGERKAAHHYLIAEIYSRKMKGSRNATEMEKNRQFALVAAQEVVNKGYPSKWRVSEHARTLIRDLADAKFMATVKQRVTMRENSAGDSAKEAIADAQRRYLDATQGGGQGRTIENASQTESKFTRVPSRTVPDEVSVVYSPSAKDEKVSGPSEPAVTRSFSTSKAGEIETPRVSERLQQTGLLTSQPSGPTVSTNKPPILINGRPTTDSTVDAIAQNNLAQLLEAARKRKESSRSSSPYATGQNPTSTR